MDNENILLSICIPTYNRETILEKTLYNLVNNPDYNDYEIEIVISDNCSTDNTQNICLNYSSKYRNIKYKKLDENIGANLNMSTVLSMGTGKYLKLINDYVSFKEGMLKKIINTIKSSDEISDIYFYGNIGFLNNNKTVEVNSVDEFVLNVSYWVTWITNFGVWRKDFEKIENKDRFAYLYFPHMDWTFNLVGKSKSNTIIFDDFYQCETDLGRRGGFNYFEVYITNYFAIYSEYLNSKQISQDIFLIEKKRYYLKFLISNIINYIIFNNHKFDSKGGFKILIYNYYYHNYFYFGLIKLILLIIRNIFYKIRNKIL